MRRAISLRLESSWGERRSGVIEISVDGKGVGSSPACRLGIVALMSFNVITPSLRLPLTSPQHCWRWTCSPGASWPRCSTANGS